MRRRTLGLLAFAGAAAGGATLGYLGERRVARVGDPVDQPRWAELQAPPPVEARTVEAFDGTQLHVVTAGPVAAPGIVLVHGYAVSWRFWHYQIRDLAGEFRVVAYDQRGHADSEPAASGEYTTDALARDLRAVIDAVSPDAPVVVVGHSMGGMTIMGLADEFPPLVATRLAGAVLCNTASSRVVYRGIVTALSALVAAAGRLPGMAVTGGRLPRRVSATDAGYLLTRRLVLTPDADPALVGFVEQLALACPVDVMAGFGRMLATLDLDAALENLSVPTLVLAGERDRLTAARHARRLVEALPQGRLVEVEGSGHMSPLEEHARVTELLGAHARMCFARADSGAA